MEIKILGSEELVSEIATAIDEEGITVSGEGKLGLGGGAYVAGKASVIFSYATAIYKKLLPYITARPSMELEFVGPNGTAKLKMSNVSEETIRSSIKKVSGVAFGDGDPTPV